MKLKLFQILIMTAFAVQASAIPARPGAVKAMQPDGSTVTLVLHGDEFRSFTTTHDGYTVVRTDSGWQYALKKDGALVSSGIMAHDVSERTSGENSLLTRLGKMTVPDMTAGERESMRRAQSLRSAAPGEKASLAGGRYDYNNFRGLVILVEWNDCGFTRTDSREFFSSMINDEGYGGYYTQDATPQWVSCTGSVRDYFSDNSMGLFKPEFDVVGPVRINRSCKYPSKTSNGTQCAYEALQAADGMVDFSKYDTDGDGTVDMFYIIYAGYGSNISGNDEAYIWPYASSMAYFDIRLDGVRMGRYACSTELCASERYGQKILDGIGTICHEFSHVLGLPDLYDTDYSDNGQSDDPGVWSVMAGGGYLDNSRTPAGYGAYERYAVGFMQPEKLTEKDRTYTLEPINISNKAYRIDSSVDKEFFLLENRQRTRWDSALPGEGLLIFRVDSTNASVWTGNRVNCDPSHNYYELLRADPRTSNGTIVASGYDPFPGLGNVTEINNETTPSLLSWTGEPTPLSLHSIKSDGGVISFGTGGAEVDKDIEDFEAMELTSDDATDAEGVFCKWDMVKARVVETTDDYGTGNKTLGIVRGGSITSSALLKPVNTFEFDFWNATPINVIIRTYSSTDGGVTWNILKDINGQTQATISNKKSSHLKYLVNLPAGSKIRIQQDSGMPTSYNYIDNIGVMFGTSDASNIGLINMNNGVKEMKYEFYNLSGQRVSENTKGLVIVKTRTADGRTVTRKIMKR